MDVLTWNLLHRVHAMNWDEEPVRAHPVEADRIARIADRVASFLQSIEVVALQEVSGDQLARIRERLPPGASCLTHRYPRVPKRRDGSAPDLEDPTEHLVLVSRLPAQLHAAETFRTDPGKGFLAAVVTGTIIIGTHVSFGERRDAQLARLRDVAPAAVILGDFNAGPDVVAAAFAGASLSSSIDPSPTRIAHGEHAAVAIDHVVARGPSIASAEVLHCEGLSDHHPVRARIVP
jgi:endonuclease/exonuclease/phosphatase family metal-dependent hydrolase